MSKGLDFVKRFKETFGDGDLAFHNASDLKQSINDVEKELKDGEELDKHLDFSDGALMSGFDYKGQQIVAMPLKEYDKLMKKDKALEIIKNKGLYPLSFFNDYNAYYNYCDKNPIYTQEEFELLKEIFGKEKYTMKLSIVKSKDE